MQIGKTAAIALGGEATGLAARHEAQILETRTSAGALDRWISRRHCSTINSVGRSAMRLPLAARECLESAQP
jgi:hypothetical protein